MRLIKTLIAATGIACASYATYFAVTWLRFGRRKQSPRAGEDSLLDQFMPAFDVSERHEVAVVAPTDVTLAAAKEMVLGDSPLIRAIFKARELLLRSKPDTTPPRGLMDQMKALGWGMLADVPEREVVMGGVTKPWEANPVFRPLAPDQFAAFDEPENVKIAWTLAVSAA